MEVLFDAWKCRFLNVKLRHHLITPSHKISSSRKLKPRLPKMRYKSTKFILSQGYLNNNRLHVANMLHLACNIIWVRNITDRKPKGKQLMESKQQQCIIIISWQP